MVMIEVDTFVLENLEYDPQREVWDIEIKDCKSIYFLLIHLELYFIHENSHYNDKSLIVF